MININLIPDVKSAYLKSQKIKYATFLSTAIVAGIFIAATVLLWLFTTYQSNRISSLESEISDNVNRIKQVEDLEKIVTVKNQLTALPNVHSDKPVSSRVFQHLEAVVPENIGLSQVDMAFTDSTAFTGTSEIEEDGELQRVGGLVEITGRGESFKDVNVFADALKNATFTTKDLTDETKAFYKVKVNSLDKDVDEGSFFVLQALFHDRLYDFGEEDVKLIVPRITSSPSVQEDIFTAPSLDEIDDATPTATPAPEGEDETQPNEGAF